MLSTRNLQYFTKNVIIDLQLFFQSYSEFRCIFLQLELWIRFFNILFKLMKNSNSCVSFKGKLVD